jgi:hypothetical protein
MAGGRPSIQPAGSRPPWAFLGAAFDYRFHFFFTAIPADQLMARLGARRLALADAGNFAPVAEALDDLV